MIRLLTMVALLSLSSFGWASAYPDKYEGVPYTFKDGDTIKAEDFNNNNESIKEAINNISSGTATTGATGPAGDKGDKGDTGATGPAGADGAKGDTGPAGADGADGPQGEKGDTGDKGDTGEQGIQGIQGEQGPAGNNGVQGVKGDTGAQGVAGNNGQDGADGVGFPGVVATLRSSSLPDHDGSSASYVFDAMTNIASNSFCNSNDCELYVEGVSDHRRCVTQIEGVGTWGVSTDATRIAISNSQTTGNWVAIVIHCIN